MANPISRVLDDCRKEEETLAHLVADQTLNFRQIEESLSRLRSLCSRAILSDFDLATSPTFRAEERLWDNHQKVNSRFRSELASLRKSSERKPVELRKLAHEYLKFIKSSQSFYRNLVKQLDQTYGGIPSLRRVVSKLHPKDASSTSETPSEQPPHTAKLESCCHSILIRLGDLSRYRETELAGSEKNWGPAHGYYDLALTVCPASGIPYNQRAVIALADKTLFRALYFVYRSICATESHPQGQQNLRRALQKIQQAWNSKEVTTDPAATVGAALPKGLVAWYVRLVEVFFHGKATTEKDELENEVITQLKVDLRQNPSAESPCRLVLTGIAAQQTAQERFELDQSGPNQDSFLLFLQLNVRIFNALLSVFVAEVSSSVNDTIPNELTNDTKTQLTATMRRILPVLRLYSLWLDKTCNIINSSLSGIPLALKTEFWINYAKSLSLMISEFAPESLPDLPYLLEEDEDTIGFKPLLSNNNRHVWYQNENLKPRWHEYNTPTSRNADEEMKFRIREFTLQGLELSLAKRIPASFLRDERSFIYEENQVLDETASVVSQVPVDSSTAVRGLIQVNGKPEEVVAQIGNVIPEEDDQDQEAQRMVDNIVGGRPKSAESIVGQYHQTSTPPHTVARRGSGKAVSPLLTSRLTVNEIMAAAYRNPQPLSPSARPLDMQRSRSGSRPNSTIHSPTVAPLQPRQSADMSSAVSPNQAWPQTQFQEDPALPGLGIIKETYAASSSRGPSSPKAGTRLSLPIPPSHSRVNSSESTRGIWGGGIFDPTYGHNETAMGWKSVGAGQSEFAATSSQAPQTLTPQTIHNGQNIPWNHTLQSNQNETSGSSSGHVADRTHFETELRNQDSRDYRGPWNVTGGSQLTHWHQT